MSSPLAQKIRDQRLRKLAEGGSGDETIDVIVELDVSLPKVVMEKDAHADHRVARPVAVQPLGAEAQREVDRKVLNARATQTLDAAKMRAGNLKGRYSCQFVLLQSLSLSHSCRSSR